MLSFVLLFVWCFSYCMSAHTNFILIGATGNLAKKYIWDALYQMILQGRFENDNDTLTVYGASRQPFEAGTTAIQSTIQAIKCLPSVSSERHRQAVNTLSSISSYVQLATVQDYAQLSERLNDPANSVKETTRIYYLSISPSIYNFAASAIHTVGRPLHKDQTAMRVIFEKPFGKDMVSAKALSDSLQAYLEEAEIYRVDHYLGKQGIQSIAEFRKVNQEVLEALQLPPSPSRAHNGKVGVDVDVEEDVHVDVTLIEMENVQGRTMFYDEYGVIRDVMQNHMTQAFVYATMDYSNIHEENTKRNYDKSKNTFGELEHRLRVLGKTNFLPSVVDKDVSKHLWLGQYSEYSQHVLVDSKNTTTHTNTPTAAKVHLQYQPDIAAPALAKDTPSHSKGVSVIFSAGKSLHDRLMDVHISRVPTNFTSPSSVHPILHENHYARKVNVLVDGSTSTSTSSDEGRNEECGITYHVQGGKRSNTFGQPETSIVLTGSCWYHGSAAAAADDGDHRRIEMPSGWRIATSAGTIGCDEQIRRNIHYSEADTACEDGSKACEGTKVCVLAPITAAESSNAYVAVLQALFDNDRSLFTGTEELVAQWRIWDSVNQFNPLHRPANQLDHEDDKPTAVMHTYHHGHVL